MINDDTIHECGEIAALHADYEQRILELEAQVSTYKQKYIHWKGVADQYQEFIRGIYADATHLKKSIDESFDEFGKSFPEDTWSDA